MVIKKGDIVIVNLNPTKGSEQRGIRPAIIFQTDKANKVSPHTIIVPLTTKIKEEILPSHALIKVSEGVMQDSVALAEQIRVIDKSRIIDVVGIVSPDVIKRIEKSIKIILDME